MKELMGAILSQNHRRRQGVAQGARAPTIEIPPTTKVCQKSLVSSFSVSFSILAYNSTRVQQYLKIILTTMEAQRTLLLQFLPTNLNV